MRTGSPFDVRVILTYSRRRGGSVFLDVAISTVNCETREKLRLEKMSPRVCNGLAGILLRIVAIKKIVGVRKFADAALRRE